MGVKKKTIAEVSKETLLIQDYLRKCKNGVFLPYAIIASESGVVMDTKGKQYLRRALKRSKLEYSPVRGQGVRLADAEMCMPLVIDSLSKIDRAVRRGEKRQRNVQEQFFEQLSGAEQKQLLFVGAAFGAIRVAAENGKLLYQSRKRLGNVVEIDLPNYDR